ncbi:MAG TPA: TetR/AcrR family transcriptional regulator [Spirochaetia bacterium]|nr:TetR/AcrR family transcriptional regulator [Spirochaetia bacterium]
MNVSFTLSPKRQKREIEIFEAALSVFAEYGFRKAGIEDIAGRLEIAPATLYRYARDKRDLYRKAVEYAFEAWQDAALAAAAEVRDPVGRFRTLCRAAFEHLGREPRLRRILAADPALFPVADAEDPYSSINERSRRLLERTIEEGVEAGAFAAPDPRAASILLFSLYRLFIDKAYVEEEADEAALLEKALDLVLDGLRAR